MVPVTLPPPFTQGLSVEIKQCTRILSLDEEVEVLSSLLILREMIHHRNHAMEISLPCRYFDLIGSISTGD